MVYTPEHILAENRRARFDYDVLETYEAGIELLGQEVKSVKGGKCNLSGAYAILRAVPRRSSQRRVGGEVVLLNAEIPAYQPKNAPSDYEPARTRRLLLRRDEMRGLIGKLHEKSLTLVPLDMHVKRGFIKVALGLCRSRKKHDKREVLKKRAMEKEMRRAV